MHQTLDTRAVGHIVAEDWRTAAVFERFGIDFCCGGRQTVAEACRSAGVEVAQVEQALAAIDDDAEGDEVAQWPITRLVAHIEQTHHAYVREALPRISGYLAKLERVHGARHPELAVIASTVEALARELLQHMTKEERILFPYIRELATQQRREGSPFGTVENPIRMMEREHAEAGALIREIRVLTDDYAAPPDGCVTYRVCFQELAQFERDLHRHVHLENNILFPRAIALEAARPQGGQR